MSKIKGQNFRLLLNANVVPEATNCTVTMSADTENTKTKDDPGLYSKTSVSKKSWSAQVDSYQSTVAQLKAIITMFNAAAAVPVGYDQTSGTTNSDTEDASFARSGNAILNDFTFNFNDRETISTSLQFQGTGALS